jgi:ATP-dependent helicase/nuclease subunit B
VRVSDLRAFRAALTALACDGTPLSARDRLVVVPTRAAGELLRRSIEARALVPDSAIVLPDLLPADHLVGALARRLDDPPPVLDTTEREALLGAACRAVRAQGIEPPFALRPGLVREMLRLYDELRERQRTVDTFERIALGLLEPGAAIDRGAERLVKQTHFLVAAFRELETRGAREGADLHELRRLVVTRPAARPMRHVVVAVADQAYDPYGLCPADWDLLARVPHLDRLDVVATDGSVAGPFHEAIHRLLPGIEEVRFEDADPPRRPVLTIAARDALTLRPRDREEEVAGFAGRVKVSVRSGRLTSPSQAALVVDQRLPYVYLAREVCRAAGVPCQMFDALPLAAEPYAAVLDLVVTAVASNFARAAAVALLRTPHLRLGEGRVSPRDVDAFDRALAESGYLGDPEALARLAEEWAEGDRPRLAVTARVIVESADALAPLQEPQPAATHVRTLLEFLVAHDVPPAADDPVRDRQLRARSAVQGILHALADAYERFDPSPVVFAEVRALIRRWIDAHTFAPRAGDGGVHIVDSASARFGEFEMVQLAGLVEGEWPAPPRRNIFYSSTVLRELGWPSEQDRLHGARSAFADLLGLPRDSLAVSSFLLEADSPTSVSPLLAEVADAGLDTVEAPTDRPRVFDHEALIGEPVQGDHLGEEARRWLALRVEDRAGHELSHRGFTAPHDPGSLSLGAMERYLDCPFKFFASTVLRLDEPPDQPFASSPRARGRFLHQVLERFFHAWDASGVGPITPGTIGHARRVFAEVAEPLLSTLSESDASVERMRLLGSAISPGVVETLLVAEASRRPEPVLERWLEHRFEGTFALGQPDDPTALHGPIALHGVVDRVDLLRDRRLRVIDYKSGGAPQPKQSLQPQVYALCMSETLEQRDGAPWRVDEASYLAFGAARAYVPKVLAGSRGADERLDEARERVRRVAAGVRAGEFPPRPLDEMSCRYCPYASVCRKDYVVDA